MTHRRKLLAYPWSAIVLTVPCGHLLAVQLVSVSQNCGQDSGQDKPAQAATPGSLILDFKSSLREKTKQVIHNVLSILCCLDNFCCSGVSLSVQYEAFTCIKDLK